MNRHGLARLLAPLLALLLSVTTAAAAETDQSWLDRLRDVFSSDTPQDQNQDARGLERLTDPGLQPERARIALVIGNARYRNQSPLQNTLNDARDMSALLKTLGFDVIAVEDADRDQMADAITDFLIRLDKGPELALFYYSGHGLQVDGVNYLVPVDAKLRDELDVPTKTVALNTLLRGLDHRPDSANVIILDSCRDNPYQQGGKSIGSKGLATSPDAPQGTLILYATKPGQTASDNPGGRNGLFTKYLLKNLSEPGVEVEAAFKQVAQNVWHESGRRQLPWYEGMIFGQFYFRPPPGPGLVPPPPGPVAPPVVPPPPALVGYLQVTTNAPGTEVYLNGQRLGRASPDQPLEYRTGLPVGNPELQLRVPEHKDQRRRVTIRANQWTQASVELEREGPDLEAKRAECRAHMGAQRYTNPEDDNALLCYQEIERLDPGNREAKQAYADMTAFYLDSGQTALQAGNRERVADRIERLRWIDPASPAAAQLEAALAKTPEPPPEPAHQSFEPQMIAIRGGCFEMGSPPSEDGRNGDERQHRVCVDGFKIGQFEVTQAQWEAVMGNNPSHFSGCANCPVENVSWNDVQNYIAKLNARTGKRYRLPTEAEWEYAARAGSTTAYPWGNSVGRNRANCAGCGSQWDNERTAPAGSFQPNAWGLYDTPGNVWEWTCSAYDKDYGGAEQHCEGNNHTGNRAYRGGSWDSNPRWVRSSVRGWNTAAQRGSRLGFRLAQD